MKKWSTKSATFLFIVILLAINSGFLFSYYNFYLTDRITDDLSLAKEQNHENLYVIASSIEEKSLNESVEIIKKYIKNNGGYATLKTPEGDVIFSNKEKNSKLFSSMIMVEIGDKTYELYYSKIAITPGMNLVRNFMFYEIIFVSTIVIIVYFISSRRIIDPIETITKDINAYKFGKRPFKRKMPKKMQQIQNTFVDMVDSLELEKENQNQIIASISHDLKTPLTAVIGYADRLKKNDLSSEKKEKYLEKIYGKALMMKVILEEFDDYQSCNLKETLKLCKISVTELCETLKKDYEEDLLDKKINFSINFNCGNKFLIVDLVKIKRVFNNIITNSVNHFKGREGKIVINITFKNNILKVETADDGGGIKEEKNLKRIFEPFYTSDPSRKISGLGLSICKQIISSHNGVIYAENNKIGGLSIIFLLPIN